MTDTPRYKKWVDIANLILTGCMVVVTGFLVYLASKQADAAKKQAVAADQQAKAALVQIEVAKQQLVLMEHLNEENRTSDLKARPVTSAYYSSDFYGPIGYMPDGYMPLPPPSKIKIDLLFRNLSPRPTAIVSISLMTKNGHCIRMLGDSDGINLPLNIAAWSAERISFSLKKEDTGLDNIVITDLDNKKTIAKDLNHESIKFIKP